MIKKSYIIVINLDFLALKIILDKPKRLGYTMPTIYRQNGFEVMIYMAKVKIGPWEIEEAELDRQHREAQQRGQEQLQTEPQARAITYDQPKGQFVIELKSGVTVLLPAHLLQGLDHATPEALADVQLGPRGASLHWETLGVSFSLAGLLAGVFGTRAWMQEMGRRGGSATSTAKAAAARLNGKKGGRPAKAGALAIAIP